MAPTKFKLNHSGMKALLNSAGVRGEMMRRAESAATAARASAPVESGAYRDSITVVSATTDRAVGRVVAGVDYAMAIEFGTRNLGRSLDAAGG